MTRLCLLTPAHHEPDAEPLLQQALGGLVANVLPQTLEEPFRDLEAQRQVPCDEHADLSDLLQDHFERRLEADEGFACGGRGIEWG